MAQQGWLTTCCLATLAVVSLLALASTGVDAGYSSGLYRGFYNRKCPNRHTNVESIVRNVVAAAFQKDPTLAAGLVRIHFHDAFVQGADASLLLDGPNSEKTSPANGAMHGFDVIEAAKAAVEEVCPGVVSCADILTYATRDAIWLSYGPFIKAKGGRRDGLVSLASNVNGQLPGPFQLVPALTTSFANKGLSQQDLVVLSGAHTIGAARCRTFQNRLFTFGTTGSGTDPALNPDFAAELKQQCPAGQNLNDRIPMDSFTPNTFDNAYYVGLLQGRGIFTSDDDLAKNPDTAPLVKSFASKRGGRRWLKTAFPISWLKLSEIGVKTGTEGEIRKICSQIN